jgi:hypothetical protein
MARIVVTGCARSGTQYTWMVLSRLGLRATHEKVFNHDLDPVGFDPALIDSRWRDIAVECSWMAPPFFTTFGIDSRVWFQLRHPLKILRCFRHTQLLNSHDAATKFIHKVLPECGEGSVMQRAVGYVLGWWKLMDDVNAYRYRVEDLTVNRIYALLRASGVDNVKWEQIHQALLAVGKDTGTCGHDSHNQELTWDEVLACRGGEELRKRSQIYGYL